jgi:hypothetical protein
MAHGPIIQTETCFPAPIVRHHKIVPFGQDVPGTLPSRIYYAARHPLWSTAG